MTLDYLFFYTEANIVCIAIFVILLWHDRRYSTRQEKQIWFDRTALAHILYFLSDIGWAAVISGYFPRTRFLVILFNFMNFIFLSLIAYGWFMYMAAAEDMILGKTWKQRRLLRLPVWIAMVVMIVRSGEEGVMEKAITWLREFADKKREDNNLLYRLDLSAGYDVLQTAPDTMEDCLKRADEKLYENKRAAGTARL